VVGTLTVTIFSTVTTFSTIFSTTFGAGAARTGFGFAAGFGFATGSGAGLVSGMVVAATGVGFFTVTGVDFVFLGAMRVAP
jgi:hypothetical protein